MIEGVASVNESAITGESAPVIRESGGDRSAVTGGTQVLSDWIKVRITTQPGSSFIDRMIALVEGAAVVSSLDGDVSSLVDYVEVRTVDEILLHLRDGRLVRWGSAEQSEDKAAVLLQLLRRKAEVYDVSVPGSPTTK